MKNILKAMIFIFISQQSFSSSTSKWLNPTTRKLLSKIFSQRVNNPETNPILAGLGTVGREGNVVIWCKVGRTIVYNLFK